MIGEVELYRLRENPENPREISEEKFGLLVKSVLVFPRMLWLSPIVYDEEGVVLGGNMRLRALNAIADMDDAEREDIIKQDKRLVDGQVSALVDYWQAWASEKAPRVPAVKADDLTEEQKKEFIIKDNTSFGKWDFDKLANEWDSAKLSDWGMDVWNSNPTVFAPLGTTQTADTPEQAEPDVSEDDGTGEVPQSFDGELPPEIDGQDLTPDELPKYEGEENTPCDYITITFENSERELLAERLGVSSEKLFEKICWRIEELIAMQNEEGENEQ